MNINSSFVAFIGFFAYDKSLCKSGAWKKDFVTSKFYTKNRTYLEQKYYSNWLHSMFSDDGDLPNAYTYKHTEDLGSSHDFTVSAVEVLLYSDDIGIFVIKFKNNTAQQSWENVVDFVNVNRLNHHFKTQADDAIIQSVLSSCLIGNFVHQSTSWQNQNAQLKVFTNVDVTQFDSVKHVDTHLFALGNHSYPNQEEGLFHPSNVYFQEMMSAHSISVYDNWKGLCLYDSLSRISENLDEIDTYKLWENEYLYIYINTLIIRFFLQKLNDDLVDLSEDSKKLIHSRNLFFELINQFNHSKISYKFLPNLLFTEFKKSMEITPEINSVEKKIERLNAVLEEKTNKKIQNILTLLTILSIFSVAGDAGTWLGMKDKTSWVFIISASIFISAITVILLIYFRKEKS